MEVRTGAGRAPRDGTVDSFADAVEYLATLRSPVATPGLDRMRSILDLLGSPERAVPSIGITGTNGKGSVARLIDGGLRALGRRTGRYTSPHLEEIRERITLDGAPIAQDAFAAHVSAVRAAIDAHLASGGARPTHFEALTAVAFSAFAASGPDALVLEVGIGGRNDATNTADSSVGVVTNVDLDHTEVLGSTREAIATEKAGIIKPGATAVIGSVPPEVRSVLDGHCREVDATPWRFGREIQLLSDTAEGSRRRIVVATPNGRTEVALGFWGRHQAENAALALGALEAFLDGPVDPVLLDRAWQSAENPGRFEILEGTATVVVDVAHNPHGVRALVETLVERFGERRWVVVLGVNPHKDAEAMLESLRDRTRDLITTEVDDAPAVPATTLAKLARELGFPHVEVEVDPARAVRHALSCATPDDVVVLTGSHYWIGRVHGALPDLVRIGSRP